MSATTKSPQSWIKATMWWNTFKQHGTSMEHCAMQTTHTALGDSTGVCLMPSKIRQQLGRIILLNWQWTAPLRAINLIFDWLKIIQCSQCVRILQTTPESVGSAMSLAGKTDVFTKQQPVTVSSGTEGALLGLTMFFTYVPKHTPAYFYESKRKERNLKCATARNRQTLIASLTDW